METTTKPATSVHPARHDRVRVSFGDHLIIGRVILVHEGAVDVIVEEEYLPGEDENSATVDPVLGSGVFTLFDVEQADARCVVTVL